MAHAHLSSRRRNTAPHWTAGDINQFDAMVAACVLMAHADGWTTPEERKRMIERLQALDAFAVFGAHEALLSFDALSYRLERDPEAGEAMAERAIARLVGQAGPSRLLVEAACAVADADGGFDSEERDVIFRLCSILRLDPEAFEPTARSRARR